MGNSLSPVVSSIFMEHFERLVLDTADHIGVVSPLIRGSIRSLWCIRVCRFNGAPYTVVYIVCLFLSLHLRQITVTFIFTAF
jgi:hypothetical protein